jgi:3-phenylpropionate/trans-cinnamate dioxygenase ferredoxin reductase subunit
MSTHRVVIVGGGQAAGAAARKLRALGYDGALAMVSDEESLPYERPPLSKAATLGGSQFAGPQPCWKPHAHDTVMLASKATAIDRQSRTVVLADGGRLPYDRVLLATGGRPRALELAGSPADSVLQLRTLRDAERLHERLAHCVRHRLPVLAVGASWIGLEVAACARKLGLEVTVADPADRLCARTLPLSVSAMLHAIHVAQGVRIRLGCSVTRIEKSAAAEPGEAWNVVLSDGTALRAGAVVAGIGIVPHDELARACGLACDSGILVDADGRTCDPNIFAAGDVASQYCPWNGASLRQETWSNANSQAERAAAAIARDLVPDATAGAAGEHSAVEQRSVPWFWSEQFDHDLHVLGAPHRADTTLHLPMPGGPGIHLYLRDGALIGAAALDQTREMLKLRRLMSRGEIRVSHLPAGEGWIDRLA